MAQQPAIWGGAGGGAGQVGYILLGIEMACATALFFNSQHYAHLTLNCDEFLLGRRPCRFPLFFRLALVFRGRIWPKRGNWLIRSRGSPLHSIGMASFDSHLQWARNTFAGKKKCIRCTKE